MFTKTTRVIRSLLATSVAACAGMVLLYPAASVNAAGLLIAQGGFGGQLEVAEHDVHVTMNNGVVVTTVTQVFQNKEDRVVEALYTFPVPKAASVSNFSMWINGKEMTGEVVEKQRARQIYESYKQRRQDPGLLEQVDYRTFEMRVFPIAPKAQQKIQVTYYQELDFDHDVATYVYPLASTTRKDLAAKTAGKFSFTLDAKSEIPLVKLESPSHPKEFAIATHTDTYTQASLEVSGGDLQKDVVLTYQQQRPRTGLDIVTSKQANEDGYFLLTLTAGEELAPTNAGMDYVFVVDISGSMSDDNKLVLARKATESFIKGLSPQDRFEIVTFNVQPNMLFKQLRAADEQAKAQAGTFLDTREACGGTVLKPALSATYKYAQGDKPLNIVILSDGLTEQAERAQLIELLNQRPNNVRAFAIGVGNDINRQLLEQFAEKTGGLAAFVSNADNFEQKAQAFRRKLMRPAMTDLKLTFPSDAVYDVEPMTLGNLYHGAPLRMYGRYKTTGPVNVTLEGKISGQAFSKTFPIDLPKSDLNNPQIERMWASHRVDRLLKDADAQGNRNPETLTEVVRLGEGYSIVTEYTSFLVLENDGEYQRWKIDRKNALRMARDRRAQEALASRLDTLRQKAANDIGPIAEAAKPAVNVNPQQVAQTPLPQTQTPGQGNAPQAAPPSRGFDLDIPHGGGGGGAIDPVSGSLLVTLGIVGLLATRRRKNAE